MTAEQWRPVVGWEGAYEVSDLGRVRSLDRYVRNKHGYRITRGCMLKPQPNSRGYLFVWLGGHRTGSPRTIHRLVLEAFVGLRPTGMVCRHGPGGALDNRLVNLCWGTREENKADELRDQTRNRGVRHGNAKLTDEIVMACRRRHASGETLAALAAEFGVHRVTIGDAVIGRTWGHLSLPR